MMKIPPYYIPDKKAKPANAGRRQPGTLIYYLMSDGRPAITRVGDKNPYVMETSHWEDIKRRANG